MWTDRRLFRRLHVADLRLVEMPAWSSLAEELKEQRRRRLSNRVGQQLWRYYPQMQKLTDDLAAPWFIKLWTIAPTPAKARRLLTSTVERLLRQHRIRRLDAETVLGILREPAIKVVEGAGRRPVSTCARCSLGCGLSITSYGRPKANSRSSA